MRSDRNSWKTGKTRSSNCRAQRVVDQANNKDSARITKRLTLGITYPTHFLALRHSCIHGLKPDTSWSVQLICTLRNTRSGCGIMAVKRPSAVVTAVRPPGLPFGLNG